jgi:DNA-directed RNA polymerase subunit beta'
VHRELGAIRERARHEVVLSKRSFDEFQKLHTRKIIEDETLWRELRRRYALTMP